MLLKNIYEIYSKFTLETSPSTDKICPLWNVVPSSPIMKGLLVIWQLKFTFMWRYFVWYSIQWHPTGKTLQGDSPAFSIVISTSFCCLLFLVFQPDYETSIGFASLLWFTSDLWARFCCEYIFYINIQYIGAEGILVWSSMWCVLCLLQHIP